MRTPRRGRRISLVIRLASLSPASWRKALGGDDLDGVWLYLLAVDSKALRYVRDALVGTEYVPVVTGDLEALPGLIRAESPKLVLLDLMLPGTDGIDLMERVPKLADLPVIFISAYGRDETIPRALETGAADYIVKPFSPPELVARIRAALRRDAAPGPYVIGDLEIHYEERRVSVAGRPIRLTATEFELLRVLSRGGARFSTPESILRQVWGERQDDDTEPVRTYVKTLRWKLGGPAYIVTMRGVGYRMARPDDA